ncbi:MAG: DNA mismatch repair protein MutS [Ruminococcus sp.]|nr:DNA mismatch repair protein MutS [Ruminococcus sp.]
MKKTSEFKDIPDLFYPSAEKRRELNERRLRLAEGFPCTYLNDLMAESVASVVCRRNPAGVMKLFGEMCTDRDTAEYRLDALEDVLYNPRLSPALHKIIRTLLDSEHRNIPGMASPDSFTALSDCIDALELYIYCMDDMHELYLSHKENIRSAAFSELFDGMEERYSSEEFSDMKKDVAEIKKAFSERIRSVTVAINFNAEMRPVSAGITGWSDKPVAEKPSVFDRLFYKNNAFSQICAKGKMRTDQPDENGFVNEADRALFKALGKLTDFYMNSLASAVRSYERLEYGRVSMLEDQLDIYDGVARIVTAARSRGIKMCRPRLDGAPRTAEIKGLFDPCFFFKAAAADTDAREDALIVRNDISMNGENGFFILTGANNGGKTTFVRAAGLCFLMGQTGFYVPAESCVIGMADHIFTHFPKEEETGINASRFTTEIKDMKTIIDLITENSLLLMNESIQSTTPKECGEIAEELVRIFCIIGVRGIFATHITELALKCAEIAADPDCRSIPVSIVADIDPSNGKRLYKIRKGEPLIRSYAQDIFRAAGINAEEIRSRKRQGDDQ